MDNRIIQVGEASFNSTAGAVSAYAGIAIQSVKGDHAWDDEVIKDFGGFDYSWLARNTHITITIAAKLTAASKALAIANAVFLLPFTSVTLSGFDAPWLNVTGVAGLYTGSWQYYKGGTIDMTNDKVGGIDLPLKKYSDPTQNTLATTAAS
jgi:hypothetical protein